MAKTNVSPEYREVVKMFESLSGSKSLWQVYSDVIECIALSIQNQWCFGKRWKENEKAYKIIIDKYNEEERLVIPKIYAKIVKMLEDNPWRDLLGELYMQLNMGSDALGQFFTPYHVCQAMANVVVDDELINKEYIRINEPSCGGGANVIATLEALHKKGVNWQQKCLVVCQDLSHITALMCYIVLSMLGVAAVIKVGDTLMHPYTNYVDEVKKGSELWTTPLFHINNCYSKI